MESEDAAAAKLVANERAKLVSTSGNTLASGSILAGIVIPAASMLAGIVPSGVALSPVRLFASSAIWLLAGPSYIYGRNIVLEGSGHDG